MRKNFFNGFRHINMFFKDSLQCESGAAALILVVWVMVILVAIVGEFSYSMRTEINIVRNFKEEEESYQLALAGMETAKVEILSSYEPSKMYVSEEGDLIFDPEKDAPGRKGSLGKGNFEYSITDEEGKLNINKASLLQLKNIFLESGVDVSEVDIIVDSIIDWRDGNDLHMLNGAEEDYYSSLPKPYSCKDAPFDSIEELLLVKGMTRDILYGSEDEEGETVYEGAAKYLTVRGSGRININTASSVVLEAVFGSASANNIIAQREAGPVSRPVSGSQVGSSFFTIISKGSTADGTIKRTVKAVLQRVDKNMETVYWNDNFIG